MTFEAGLWLRLLQTLYPPAFGPIGGSFEAGAMFTAVILAFILRQHPSPFRWACAAVVCLGLAHAAFWIWIAPVNATLLPLTADTLPADWAQLRNRWEYTHAARAVLQVLALGALVCAALVNESGDASHQEAKPVGR
jgi:hypothetical protein